MEEWRVIQGHPLYEVSNRGHVRKVKTGRWLTPDTVAGYDRVRLTEQGTVYRLLIHRLILTAFIGDAPAMAITNHKNGDKKDNRLENLEWVTHSENSRHAYHILKKNQHLALPGERNHRAKLTNAQVVSIRKALVDGVGVTELSRQYHVSHSLISLIRSGKLRRE